MSGADKYCPCGSSATYADCCQLLHLRRAGAETAEQLMRSRYSAYALKLIDYLVETTHPNKRSPQLRQEISAWADQVDFYQLEILSTRQGQAADKNGKVRFIAYFRQQGQKQQFSELSRFKRYRKDWCYLDGDIGP